MLKAWGKLNYKTIVDNLDQEILWYNSHIRINEQLISWKKPIENRLLYVAQLWENRTVISWTKAKNVFGLTLLQFQGLISAVPREWKQQMQQGVKEPGAVSVEFLSTKHAYRNLVSTGCGLNRCRDKWEKMLNNEIPLERFISGLEESCICTDITKYHSFQFRLMHHAIITNIQLEKWKLKESRMCSFCAREPETYLHLFIWCPKVAWIWLQLEQFMAKWSEEPINFQPDTVFWNRLVLYPASHIKNFLCLVPKQYIYRQRCINKELSFVELKNLFNKLEGYEKHYAIMNGKLKKHLSKWNKK